MPVVRAIDKVRAGLQSLHRSTAPASVALLEPARPTSRYASAPIRTRSTG